MEEPVHQAVVSFFMGKYGEVEVEISRVYPRSDVIEVAGVMRRRGERSWRRFTVLLDAKTLAVKAFGMR